MKKIYLLSDNFDYSKLFLPDSGKIFPKQMKWDSNYLSCIKKYKNFINIIDNRITEEECGFLLSYLEKNRETIFFFKIVDPYYEFTKNHHYYKFLFTIKNNINVFFLSPYIPTEIVKDLDDLTKGKKVFLLPYPFSEEKIYSFRPKNRANKIVFSGNRSKSIYPFREKILNKINWSLFFRFNFKILEHPGYPDIGQYLKHNIIGSKYIDYLSKFVFMFLSPSRCDLEFKKYSECALAKCVPVGIPPSSFNKEMLDPFLKIDFKNISNSVNKIFSISDSELIERSDLYYRSMKKYRDPKVLNKQFREYVELNCYW